MPEIHLREHGFRIVLVGHLLKTNTEDKHLKEQERRLKIYLPKQIRQGLLSI